MKVSISVKVTGYDKHGRKTGECVVKDKTPLKWYLLVLARMIRFELSYFSMVGRDGTTERFYRIAADYSGLYIGVGLGHVLIGFGTGTTPVARTDYALEAEVGSANPTSSAVTIDTATEHEITFAVSLVWDVGGDVTEVGIWGLYRVYDIGIGAAANRWFMIDRTVLPTPVSIPAGGSVAIEYKVKVAIP